MKLLFWKKKAQKERKSRVKNGKLKLLRGLYMISKTDPCKARTEYWMNEFNVSSRTIERWFFQLEQGGYLLRDRRIKNKRVPILTEKGLEMAVEMAVGLAAQGQQTLALNMAALFLVVNLVFVFRSFYRMRIDVEAPRDETDSDEGEPATESA